MATNWPKPERNSADGEQQGVAPLDAVVVDEVGLDAAAEGVLLLLLGGEGAHDAVVGDALVEEADDAVPVAHVAAALSRNELERVPRR